ncbi:hypothetical protein PHMEG_00015347 [Phytophthora megakarya]|uniref:Uncharacterized protein n=1 Tax=Phytophthora megakarya TaxID=4795 RepID=A0A225W1K2_9STRA|nr:hypothetical protein PHMEG_00015347 [Phytophthora megakarya]
MPLRTFRRINLRPVLFLLVFFFVLVPLIVYNYFIFDFQVPPSKLHVSSLALPDCLNVDSLEFFRPDALNTLKTRCGVKNTRGPSFTYREQFTYLQFAALQSVRRVLQPDVMMMHYLETPRGVWYTQCQRHLGLHQVLWPVFGVDMEDDLNRQKRRRIVEVLVMLRALKKHGGVAFTDFNTFLLRRFGVDMEEGMVVMSQKRGRIFSLGLHMMQAPPEHPFVEFLEQKIVEMVEENDPKLHQMKLDEVVGSIVLEKYLEERNQMGGSANETRSNSIMDGVVVATSNLFEFDALHDLLTVKMKSAVAGKFRGVAGFHVDSYDVVQETADTNDLREIARMQEELTLADEWKSLDTLLGSVVRLAVTANTTAELEPLFLEK